MANIEVDGPNKTIKVDSGDLTFDIPGDIVLDAGGADIIFKDDGTSIAHLTNSSSDLIVESKVSDKDIIFKVNDGGSATEVARFDGDVSAFKIASGKKLMLGAAEEYISGDGTDITFAVGSSGDINIPADIGLTFGDDGEKIEGDGTDLTISANNLIIDAAADITLDAAGNNLTFKSGGTSILDIVNSSSDVVIKPMVDAKDIIFQQYDGTEVARIEDNATFNVSSAGKFAYAGTAVTATAAEMNLLDGGTSVGSSITVADADGFIINDGGTMKTIPASDISAYAGGGKINQVVQTVKTDVFSTTSTSFVDVTGLTVNITPSASSSKVLVNVNLSVQSSDNAIAGQLFRDTTQIALGDASSNRSRAFAAGAYDGTIGNTILLYPNIMYLDSPSTSSQVTYKVKGAAVGGGTLYYGRTDDDTDNSQFGRTVQSITVMEVLA